MGDDRHRAAAASSRAGRRAAASTALALGAGALAGLALPPFGFPPLLWCSLALLWSQTAGRQPTGLLWGMAAVLVSHRWLLGLHPLDWVGVPAPLSLPICLLLWGLCGLMGGLLVQLWQALVRRLDPWQPATALAGACAWGLAEVFLATGPLFWIGLGGASLPGDPPLAGLAAYGGAGLVAALQLLLGWCLWRLVVGPTARRRWLLFSVALLLLSHGLGFLALVRAADGMAADGMAADDRPVAVAAPGPLPAGFAAQGPAAEGLLLLQPAIPTREKFAAQQQRRLLDQLVAAARLGGASARQQRVRSLLLPEGSLVAGQDLPEAAPVEVLSGGFRLEGGSLRSSVLRFAAGQLEPQGWVDKRRVVPLGEWVPLAGLLRWSGLSSVGGVEPGAAGRLLARPGGPIGVAICYEIADGRGLVRSSRQGALWLLASANLDPYPAQLRQQFLALARLRAIENGRWLVSVANTGPSGVVDGAGTVRQLLPEVRSDLALVQVEHRRVLTPYARWGETPLLIGLGAGLLLTLPGHLARWRGAARPTGLGNRGHLP